MADERYRREIDEVLRRLEQQHPEPVPFRLRRSAGRWRSGWQSLYELFGGRSLVERLMTGALILLVCTLICGLFAPRFVLPVASAAIACFVAGLAVSVSQGIGGSPRVDYPRSRGYAAGSPGVDWSGLTRSFRRWWRGLRG
jgi:hypothetical protein